MKLTRFFNNAWMLIKKHSPEILTVIGAVGVGVGAVMACKATTKVEEIADEFENEKQEIIDNHDFEKNTLMSKKEETLAEAGYSGAYIDVSDFDEKIAEIDRSYRKEMAHAYFKAAGRFIKLYGPSFLIITGSLASLIGANGILKKRNASLVAAYGLLKDKFDTYRENAKKLIAGTKVKNVDNPEEEKELTETDAKEIDKKLNNIKIRTTDDKKKLSEWSEYARFFDETCLDWSKDPNTNLAFLHAKQVYANQMLRYRGHVLLNDVYDSLGIPRTSEGAIVGWVYDPKNPDKQISFGIFDIYSEGARRFVNGYEPSILLDFNVDGIIYDKITTSWRG